MKMYENILKKVPLYEQKRGINYAKTDGLLYKWIMALYIAFFSFAELMNLFFLIGVYISDSKFDALKNEFYSVLALSVGLISAFIFSLYKKHIWTVICSFVFNALASVGLCLNFAPLMEFEAGGYVFAFYWRHLVPLCLILIFSVWLAILTIRANVMQTKSYKKIVEGIYSNNNISIEQDIADNDWEEILKNYE